MTFLSKSLALFLLILALPGPAFALRNQQMKNNAQATAGLEEVLHQGKWQTAAEVLEKMTEQLKDLAIPEGHIQKAQRITKGTKQSDLKTLLKVGGWLVPPDINIKIPLLYQIVATDEETITAGVIIYDPKTHGWDPLERRSLDNDPRTLEDYIVIPPAAGRTPTSGLEEGPVPSANRPVREYLVEGPVPVRLTVNDLWDALDLRDREEIERLATWQERPTLEQISGDRTPVVTLQYPKKFGGFLVGAVKINGSAYVDRSKANPSPEPPRMEEYPTGTPGRGTSDPVYHPDGKITWEVSEDRPKGPLLLKRAEQKFRMTGIYWDRGLRAVIPFGYGELSSMRYQGVQGEKQVGLVFEGIPSPEDTRLSDPLAEELVAFFHEVAQHPERAKEWNRTRDPEIYPSARPLLNHLHAYGAFLWEEHKRHLSHQFPTPGNVGFLPETERFFWADLDHAEPTENLNPWQRLARFLTDLDSAYRALLFQFIHPIWAEEIVNTEEKVRALPLAKQEELRLNLTFPLVDEFFTGYFQDLTLPLKEHERNGRLYWMSPFNESPQWWRFHEGEPIDVQKEAFSDPLIATLTLVRAHFPAGLEEGTQERPPRFSEGMGILSWRGDVPVGLAEVIAAEDVTPVIRGVYKTAWAEARVAVLIEPGLIEPPHLQDDLFDVETQLIGFSGVLKHRLGLPEEVDLRIGLRNKTNLKTYRDFAILQIERDQRIENNTEKLPWSAVPLVVTQALSSGQSSFFVDVTAYLNLRNKTIEQILNDLGTLFDA